jgi:hypothetical protein
VAKAWMDLTAARRHYGRKRGGDLDRPARETWTRSAAGSVNSGCNRVTVVRQPGPSRSRGASGRTVGSFNDGMRSSGGNRLPHLDNPDYPPRANCRRSNRN